jgi:hypothetical protein
MVNLFEAGTIFLHLEIHIKDRKVNVFNSRCFSLSFVVF